MVTNTSWRCGQRRVCRRRAATMRITSVWHLGKKLHHQYCIASKYNSTLCCFLITETLIQSQGSPLVAISCHSQTMDGQAFVWFHAKTKKIINQIETTDVNEVITELTCPSTHCWDRTEHSNDKGDIFLCEHIFWGKIIFNFWMTKLMNMQVRPSKHSFVQIWTLDMNTFLGLIFVTRIINSSKHCIGQKILVSEYQYFKKQFLGTSLRAFWYP